MCMTSQTHSAPRPSFPNHHSRENQRSTRANLPACRSGSAQLAPEFRTRCLNHRYYAVRLRQPFQSILPTATNGSVHSSPCYPIMMGLASITVAISATRRYDCTLHRSVLTPAGSHLPDWIANCLTERFTLIVIGGSEGCWVCHNRACWQAWPPLRDRKNQSSFFRYTNKLSWPNQAFVGRLPAQ